MYIYQTVAITLTYSDGEKVDVENMSKSQSEATSSRVRLALDLLRWLTSSLHLPAGHDLALMA